MLGKFVPKGWGYESWIVNKPEYCGKLLFFKKGMKCSWHYHKLKDETFYVHSGKLLVYHSTQDCLDDKGELLLGKPFAERTVLEPGDVFHVPPGMRHQMTGLLDTEMFEFSTEHFEDDSYRVLKGDQL
jgi:quercetin dioxygenase-like cupin family protein